VWEGYHLMRMIPGLLWETGLAWADRGRA